MTNLISPNLIHRTTQKSPPPSQSLRFGLLGAGSIGRHHARVLSQLIGIQLVGICDLDVERGREVCEQIGAEYFASAADLIEKCDAVVIATPTASHYELALQAIRCGKHVLVEKPLADSVEHARELVLAAKNKRIQLAVGHVERFNPVVRWFRQSIKPSEILSINITRVGPRPPRIKDVGIIIDLAVHDIDLISYLCQSPIHQIYSVFNSTSGQHEDVAQIGIHTDSGVVCGINTNWLTPYKSRKIEIATKNAFYVGDLVHGSVTFYKMNSDASAEDLSAESISLKGLEPLLEQAACFANSIIGGNPTGENATIEEACRIVELADRCLRRGIEK